MGALYSVALVACAHSEARCDRRPAQSGADVRSREQSQALVSAYEDAMKSLQRGERRAGSTFHGIVHSLSQTADYRGGFLFERLDDGDWVYRCDTTTAVFALSAYRLAILYVDDPRGGHEDFAASNFCVALQARPDQVLAVFRKEGMNPKARAIFERMKEGPHPILGECLVEDGWRHEGDLAPGGGLVDTH
jgi:hypothetical protein